MIYVYGIVDNSGVELGGLTGLDAAPVVTVAPTAPGSPAWGPDAPIAALVSFHAHVPAAGGRPDLERHHAVLEAAMARCTVLPARFGTSFASVGDLRHALRIRCDDLEHLCREVRGTVELALRAQATTLSEDEALDTLCTALTEYCVACQVSRRQPGALTAAFLVPGGQVALFQGAVARFVDARAHLRASLTGPWPPYSFTDPAIFGQLSETSGARV